MLVLSDPSPTDQSGMVEPARSTRLPPAQGVARARKLPRHNKAKHQGQFSNIGGSMFTDKISVFVDLISSFHLYKCAAASNQGRVKYS